MNAGMNSRASSNDVGDVNRLSRAKSVTTSKVITVRQANPHEHPQATQRSPDSEQEKLSNAPSKCGKEQPLANRTKSIGIEDPRQDESRCNNIEEDQGDEDIRMCAMPPLRCGKYFFAQNRACGRAGSFRNRNRRIGISNFAAHSGDSLEVGQQVMSPRRWACQLQIELARGFRQQQHYWNADSRQTEP